MAIFLTAFWVDLKTWFYLTNVAVSSNGRIEAGFLGGYSVHAARGGGDTFI